MPGSRAKPASPGWARRTGPPSAAFPSRMPRSRVVVVLFAFVALGLSLSVGVRAQTAALKLATVVPDGSIWDKSLKKMGIDWSQATGGRVSLAVFSGGSQGDEATVIRKMRVGALQGASLTVVGLANIDSSFNVFNVPFFLESYDELNALVEKLTPVLKQRVEAKGFVLLHWGHGGWLQVFSKGPVTTVADLKALRLYTSAGDDRMTQFYKAHGFQPRAMAMTDILTGLTTGMIDALPTPPLAAMAFQWYKQAPFMLDIGLTPLVGATVINKKTWDALSAADRAAIAEIGSAVDAKLRADVPKQDSLAVMLMSNQGLKVTKASGPEWTAQGEILAKAMRGQMVPPDVFDMAIKERDAFRQRKGAAAPK